MGGRSTVWYEPDQEPEPRVHDCCGALLTHRADCQLVDRKRQRAYQNFKNRKARQHE